MASLSITNTFTAGTIITAAGHNQNWTDVTTWANGNIGSDNLDTFTSSVDWNISTNSLAISAINSGTEGSATFAHNGTLASGKSAVKITSNAAQSAGTAILEIASSSASSNIPALKITDAGTGTPALHVISTTKPSHPIPTMTTTQRNALTSVVAGDIIHNSTVGRLEMYSGSAWVDVVGRSEAVVVLAESNTARSISNNSAVTGEFLMEDEIIDTHNAYSTSTAIFTAPYTGYYRVGASVELQADSAWQENEIIEFRLYKNGTLERIFGRLRFQTTAAGSLYATTHGSTVIDCTANDTLEIRLFQDSGGGNSTTTEADINWVSYERIGL